MGHVKDRTCSMVASTVRLPSWNSVVVWGGGVASTWTPLWPRLDYGECLPSWWVGECDPTHPVMRALLSVNGSALHSFPISSSSSYLTILSCHISSGITGITPTLLPYVLWVSMGIANYWMAKMARMNAASLYGLLQHPVTLGWDKDRQWENSSWRLNLCLVLNANIMSFKKTCLPKNDRRVLQMLQKKNPDCKIWCFYNQHQYW